MAIRLSVFCFFLFTFLSCDESLPPRDEPKEYLEGSYSASSGPVNILDSSAVGLGGAFVVAAKNIYSEVLQEEEFARAEIDVWLRDLPEQHGNAIATKRNLTDPSLVVGGMLTLRPNVAATFLIQWAHQTSSGKHFWEFGPLHFVPNPSGFSYWESDSVHLVASGRVQLFKTRAPVLLPEMRFTLVYRIF